MLSVVVGSNQVFMHKIVLTISLVGYLVGCTSKKEVVPVVTGQNYFPIAVGDTAIYHVINSDTAVYAPGGAPPNVIYSDYYLMEIVQDTFLDAAHGIAYKLDRYKSPTITSSSWKYDSTWYEYIDSYEAVRVENNVPFVKLSFPVKNNLQWDSDVKNIYGPNICTMVNLNKPYQLGSLSFPQSLIVLQSPDTAYDPIIGQNKRLEVYAANVGLIYKQSLYISINSSGSGGSSAVRSGVNYSQQLVSYVQK